MAKKEIGEITPDQLKEYIAETEQEVQNTVNEEA